MNNMIIGIVAQLAAATLGDRIAASNQIVEESIGKWRIENSSAWMSGQLATFTPDNKAFAVIMSRGESVLSDSRMFEVRLYQPAIVANGSVTAQEKTLLRLATASNEAAISNIRWLGDANRFAMLGRPGYELKQVYVVDVSNNTITPRTSSPTGVLTYDCSPDGKTVVYASRVAVDTASRTQARLAGVTAAPWDVGFMFDNDAPYNGEVEFFVQHDGGPPRSFLKTHSKPWPSAADYFAKSGIIRVSPDGKYAVIGMYIPDSIPPGWRKYNNESVNDFINNRQHSPPAYMLLDIQTGSVTPLIDAPSVWGGVSATWSADSRRVLITGFLPFNPADSIASRVSKLSSGALLEVDIATRRARFVANGSWQVLGPVGRDTIQLLRNGYVEANEVRGDKKLATISSVTLVRKNNSWQKTDSARVAATMLHGGSGVAASADFLVGLQQSLSEPPEIKVVHRRSGSSGVITNLHQQLRTLELGQIKRVDWISRRGDTWEAHLVTPVGYDPSRRYPAVIMIMDMGYDDSYVLDGRFYHAAYPIQALANRGFVVLMTYFPRVFSDNYVKPVERDIILAGTDGAFEYLVNNGFADSLRIAITGFSHAGFVAEYAIQSSKHRYGAAVAMDNWDASYTGYVFTSLPRSGDSFVEGFFGGVPWSKAFETWQRHSITFNVHRIQTPLLIESHNSMYYSEPRSKLFGWETYANLRRLGIPAEFVSYGHGLHILQRPIEQYTAARRQIDWLAFWLNGEEDPAPEKSAQYARWRALKKQE